MLVLSFHGFGVGGCRYLEWAISREQTKHEILISWKYSEYNMFDVVFNIPRVGCQTSSNIFCFWQGAQFGTCKGGADQGRWWVNPSITCKALIKDLAVIRIWGTFWRNAISSNDILQGFGILMAHQCLSCLASPSTWESTSWSPSLSSSSSSSSSRPIQSASLPV